MKDVCWLQLVVNGYPRPNNYFQRWFDLGKDMGIAFTRPSIRSGEPPVRKIESAIVNSSAMFITDESVISAPEIAELVYKSVEQGKRILVDLNYGTRERGNALNAFLERYGIEGTLIGLLRIDETRLPPFESSHFFRQSPTFSNSMRRFTRLVSETRKSSWGEGNHDPKPSAYQVHGRRPAGVCDTGTDGWID